MSMIETDHFIIILASSLSSNCWVETASEIEEFLLLSFTSDTRCVFVASFLK